MLTITIQIKQVYGRDTIYPVCEKAQIFAAMVGQKTLTHANLCSIEALGYQIVHAPLTWKRGQ